MEQNDGLLLDSDDSDIPDLDLPSAHIRKDRTKLFTKSVRESAELMKKRRCCGVQCALVALLLVVVVAITFLGFLSSYLLSQVEFLRNDPRYELLTRELEIVKREVNRIKTDIDLLRLMTSSPGTPTWNTSTILNNRLEHIETQIIDIVGKIQERLDDHSENDAFNSLSEQVNALAEVCRNGCEKASKTLPYGNKTAASGNEKPKKKRSKAFRSFSRDTPVVFTRTKHP